MCLFFVSCRYRVRGPWVGWVLVRVLHYNVQYTLGYAIYHGTDAKGSYLNKRGLIKGIELFWLILQSQSVIRLNWSYDTLITLVFNPVILCYMV